MFTVVWLQRSSEPLQHVRFGKIGIYTGKALEKPPTFNFLSFALSFAERVNVVLGI
jgi:hypothetical protein